MKTKRLAAMLAIVGTSLCAAENVAIQNAAVIVCMEPVQQVLMGVRPLASSMFASIGVKIYWRDRESCPVGAGAIQVRLSRDSRSTHGSSSDALAVAQPYEGSIVVFLDRVQQLNPSGGPSLMAHVLVHEITHVLEGISRHSSTGIMKARWNYDDYFEIRRKPLPFAQEDINLIYAGLKASRAVPAAAILAAVAGQ